MLLFKKDQSNELFYDVIEICYLISGTALMEEIPVWTFCDAVILSLCICYKNWVKIVLRLCIIRYIWNYEL